METKLKQPLTNLQLELLKLFSMSASKQDLLELKKFLVKHFANKAMNLADEVWDKNNWSEKDENKFLTGHLRTPYKHFNVLKNIEFLQINVINLKERTILLKNSSEI